MRKLMLSGWLLFGAFGVANAAQCPAETGHNMNQMTEMMQNCPMRVQGAIIAVTDTATGVELTITTESGNVAELRRRVEMMVTKHGGKDTKSAMMSGSMISSVAKDEEIPNGARLILTPKDPAQLEAFRKQVREHAARMQKGECSMMMPGMMGEMHKGEAAPKDEHHYHHQR